MMQKTAILPSLYLPPVEYLSAIYRNDNIIIDIGEHYVKQTYRNRCSIATANGVQDLSVPVCKNEKATAMKDIRLSEHGNWRKNHIAAINTAYGNSPYWDFLKPDFTDLYARQFTFLVDFNTALLELVCDIIEISPHICISETYIETDDNRAYTDLRKSTTARHATDSKAFKPYDQVFGQKFGFIPNLSCIDLLLNMGKESIFYL